MPLSDDNNKVSFLSGDYSLSNDDSAPLQLQSLEYEEEDDANNDAGSQESVDMLLVPTEEDGQVGCP